MEVSINDQVVLTHEQLLRVIDVNAYSIPTLILGRTGIGKSAVLKDWSIMQAERMGLQFIEWNNLTFEEKQSYVDDQKKRDTAFIFVDQRLLLKDRTDLEGLIDLGKENANYVIIKPHSWLRALQNGAGCLVLEEFNLAERSIQRASYQLLWDHQIGEFKISEKVAIFATGNVAEDRAGVKDIVLPVKKRLGIYYLKEPGKDAILEYASRHGWESEIIAYISQHPDHIFFESPKKNFTIVPRSWEMASNQLRKAKAQGYAPDYYLFSGVLEGLSREVIDFLEIGSRAQPPDELMRNGFKYNVDDFVITQYELLSVVRYARLVKSEMESKQKDGVKAMLDYLYKGYKGLDRKEHTHHRLTYLKFIRWHYGTDTISSLVRDHDDLTEDINNVLIAPSIKPGKKPGNDTAKNCCS